MQSLPLVTQLPCCVTAAAAAPNLVLLQLVPKHNKSLAQFSTTKAQYKHEHKRGTFQIQPSIIQLRHCVNTAQGQRENCTGNSTAQAHHSTFQTQHSTARSRHSPAQPSLGTAQTQHKGSANTAQAQHSTSNSMCSSKAQYDTAPTHIWC